MVRCSRRFYPTRPAERSSSRTRWGSTRWAWCPTTIGSPRRRVAVLACTLGESESGETTPTVGGQSAAVLGDEIVKYVDCHERSRLLRLHALRAGDGLTVARALGHVHEHYGGSGDDAEDEPPEAAHAEALPAPAFSLDLYPSPEQRAVAGRFIAEAREKRRSGAGVLATGDRWMLESIGLPGGVALPRLRWARKEAGDPQTAAHLAVAFDTFDSQVEIDTGAAPTAPFRVFGLLSFFERGFQAAPTPSWRSVVPRSGGGEKHPSERGHTERLDRLGRKIEDAVARHLATGDAKPAQRSGWRWPWAASTTTGGTERAGARAAHCHPTREGREHPRAAPPVRLGGHPRPQRRHRVLRLAAGSPGHLLRVRHRLRAGARGSRLPATDHVDQQRGGGARPARRGARADGGSAVRGGTPNFSWSISSL